MKSLVLPVNIFAEKPFYLEILATKQQNLIFEPLATKWNLGQTVIISDWPTEMH